MLICIKYLCFINHNIFFIGTFGIIFDDENRVLLCHRRDYDLWNLPGGGLEPGESPWDGVIREVKEETGLDVHILKLVGMYSKTDKNEIVFSFLCTIHGGAIRLNDEADRVEYFALNEIPVNISAKQIERIKDAVNNRETLLKIQTGKSTIDLLKERRT